jgi:signal transduction histidine kinase/CheY-like chemotaxis protein
MNAVPTLDGAVRDAACAKQPRPRLLVVDDQAPNVHALHHAFAADHQVFMATSGEQALALCASRQPELVLLDVEMPGMNGHEVLRRLKADAVTRDIPVIFVTGHDDEAAEAAGLLLGAVDFISKPINRTRVRARVGTHLRLKAEQDRLLRSEGEQRRLAATLNAVLDALPAHIALLDERGVITAVNTAWRAYGAANGQPSAACGVGQDFPLLCDGASGSSAESAENAACAARAAAGIRSVLAGDAPLAEVEYPCHSPTEQHWYRMQVTPLRAWPAGAAGAGGAGGAGSAGGGAVVMHVDIGERKRTELAALLEQSDALILVLDAQGRIEVANPAFIKATGLSPLEPDPRLHARWQGPLPQHGSQRVQAQQARRDGSSFIAEWTVAPIFGRDGRLSSHVCIGRDITQEQQIQEGLRQNDKLRATAMLAGAFAHDFNNLLGSVIGLTELCLIDAPQASRLERNLGRIGQASGQAANLVRQLLDFSRQTPLDRRRMGMSEMLSHAGVLLRAALPANVTLDVAVDADAMVNVDLVQWDQVLLNLTRNAAHAMRRSGGCVRMVVDLAEPAQPQPAAAPLGHVRLRIADDGEGIAPELLARIFEPFFTTKPVGEGTGLGLSAVHGIVSSHGGQIEVASLPGSGTTVSLFLPLEQSAADGDAAATSAPPPAMS